MKPDLNWYQLSLVAVMVQANRAHVGRALTEREVADIVRCVEHEVETLGIVLEHGWQKVMLDPAAGTPRGILGHRAISVEALENAGWIQQGQQHERDCPDPLDPHVTCPERVVDDPARPHIVGGKFQSDKYPTTPAGKVPLNVEDPTAQDLLWQYAQRRRAIDAQFAADLEYALERAGYHPPECDVEINAKGERVFAEHYSTSPDHVRSPDGVCSESDKPTNEIDTRHKDFRDADKAAAECAISASHVCPYCLAVLGQRHEDDPRSHACPRKGIDAVIDERTAAAYKDATWTRARAAVRAALWTHAPDADDLFDALDHSGAAYPGSAAFIDTLIDAARTGLEKPTFKKPRMLRCRKCDYRTDGDPNTAVWAQMCPNDGKPLVHVGRSCDEVGIGIAEADLHDAATEYTLHAARSVSDDGDPMELRIATDGLTTAALRLAFAELETDAFDNEELTYFDALKHLKEQGDRL